MPLDLLCDSYCSVTSVTAAKYCSRNIIFSPMALIIKVNTGLHVEVFYLLIMSLIKPFYKLKHFCSVVQLIYHPNLLTEQIIASRSPHAPPSSGPHAAVE